MAKNKLLDYLNKINDSLDKALEETIKEGSQKIEKEIDQICWSAVIDWYDSYSPNIYKRKERLLNAYKINNKNGTINWSFNSDYLDYGELNDYIFDLTLIEGWHGGAKSGENHSNPGIPYYRTPPYYSDWLKPAEHTFSVIERVQKDIEEANFGGYISQMFIDKYYRYMRRR